MTKEQRRAVRNIPLQHPKGKLYLYVDDQCHEVQAVHDVSPFGIGVRIGSAINKGNEVRLRYQYEVNDLQVHGTVIWSSVVEEKSGGREALRSYQAGIYLLPEETEVNMQFYRLMISQ